MRVPCLLPWANMLHNYFVFTSSPSNAEEKSLFQTFGWFSRNLAISMALLLWRSILTCSVLIPRCSRNPSNGDCKTAWHLGTKIDNTVEVTQALETSFNVKSKVAAVVSNGNSLVWYVSWKWLLYWPAHHQETSASHKTVCGDLLRQTSVNLLLSHCVLLETWCCKQNAWWNEGKVLT